MKGKGRSPQFAPIILDAARIDIFVDFFQTLRAFGSVEKIRGCGDLALRCFGSGVKSYSAVSPSTLFTQLSNLNSEIFSTPVKKELPHAKTQRRKEILT